METKILYCVQCNQPFTYSAIEQERAALYNFDEPLRCPTCRKKKSKITISGGESKKDKKHRRRTNKGYGDFPDDELEM